MEDIKIIQKPDWISWDDVHNLLLEAHKKNIEKGIVLRYAQMPGNWIKEKLGDEGCCWVALDGNKPVGTTSVTYFHGKSWWNKGKKVAHGCFTGILKEYQGIGLMEELNAKKYEHIRSMGVDMTEGDTAETNKTVLKVFRKDGYKVVSYFSSPSQHYSVRIVKWLNGCPFSDKTINRRFQIAKTLTKLQYKPGKIKRNWLLWMICSKIKRMLRIR